MQPSYDIIPGANLPVSEMGKNQPEYETLPVYRNADGALLSRWVLSEEEKALIAETGEIYLWQLTSNQPMQPVMLQLQPPEVIREPQHG